MDVVEFQGKLREAGGRGLGGDDGDRVPGRGQHLSHDARHVVVVIVPDHHRTCMTVALSMMSSGVSTCFGLLTRGWGSGDNVPHRRAATTHRLRCRPVWRLVSSTASDVHRAAGKDRRHWVSLSIWPRRHVPNHAPRLQGRAGGFLGSPEPPSSSRASASVTGTFKGPDPVGLRWDRTEHVSVCRLLADRHLSVWMLVLRKPIQFAGRIGVNSERSGWLRTHLVRGALSGARRSAGCLTGSAYRVGDAVEGFLSTRGIVTIGLGADT